jgi:exo-beta-1,3-glucanase (GH17 family)
MGVNYGLVGNDLPAPTEAVKLVSGLGIGRVRLFAPDAATLLALGGSGLQVVIGMGNDAIPPLTDAAAADQWILTNIVPYVPSTNITTILVGNELFSDTSLSAVWLQLVPAMQNLRTSLQNRGLSNIKLSTAAELNTLGWSYPPSKGVFRTDIAVPVMTPLLSFLNDTDSYLFINVYPYFGWRDDQSYIPMDYALFTRQTPFIVDGNHSYYNLLDAQLDAVAAAMERVAFGNVRLAISETGWPTVGAAGNVGSDTTTNAKTYNTNLISYILSKKGTPRRPGIFIPTFVFALFNENLKPGGVAEQHWGVLYPNGTQVYPLQWSNGTSASPVVAPTTSPSPVVAPAPAPASASAPAPAVAPLVGSSAIPGVSPIVNPAAVAPSVGPSAGPLDNSAARRATLGGLSVFLAIFVAFLNF